MTLTGPASLTVGGTGIRFIKDKPVFVSGRALEYALRHPKLFNIEELKAKAEVKEEKPTALPSPESEVTAASGESAEPEGGAGAAEGVAAPPTGASPEGEEEGEGEEEEEEPFTTRRRQGRRKRVKSEGT